MFSCVFSFFSQWIVKTITPCVVCVSGLAATLIQWSWRPDAWQRVQCYLWVSWPLQWRQLRCRRICCRRTHSRRPSALARSPLSSGFSTSSKQTSTWIMQTYVTTRWELVSKNLRPVDTLYILRWVRWLNGSYPIDWLREGCIAHAHSIYPIPHAHLTTSRIIVDSRCSGLGPIKSVNLSRNSLGKLFL